MSITLYGISNCDTVKKARTWLEAQQQSFAFHDFKKSGIDRALIEGWLQRTEWQILVNRQSATWHALSNERKDSIVDAVSAIGLMLELPSVIKRPVLTTADAILVGFSDALYQPFFQK